MNNHLILFTRFPLPGNTKTRLIPALGPEGAADLQRQMTEHTLESVKSLASKDVRIEVRYEGGDEQAMREWLGDNLVYASQGEGDLGSRMRLAFEAAFKDGAPKAAIIGTDCPSLQAVDVGEAFKLLDDNTLVLGPARDGGYYLMAIRKNAPGWFYDLIFQDIPWGTGQVFNATMNALAETGIDVGLLDEKADVDVPEDLEEWYKESRIQNPEFRIQKKENLLISVIIPTLNEEENIRHVLDQLKATDVEIVVVDGGSTDGTVEICVEAGVNVTRSDPGRGRQMNAGADAASGNVFLFLHADTRLPDVFEEKVKENISGGAVGGAFFFGTDADTISMNIIENMAHFRSIRMGIVFGDQAIFATREAFYRAGTFPDQPVMEDYELWKRLGRVGNRTLIEQSVTASSRKWEKYGTWRLTLLHQAVMWLYLMGASPERLARWYRGKLRKMENGR